MIVVYLADTHSVAALAGRIVGSLVLPVAGLILLITGIRKRSAARKQAPVGYPPGYEAAYQPGYQAPPGYPPIDPRLGQPFPPAYPPAGGYPMPPQPGRPKPAGTGFIIAGVVLLVLGTLGIVGSTLVGGHHEASGPTIGDCFTNAVVSDPPDWSPHSCTDTNAVLQYAADADSSGNCPDGKQASSAYLSVQRQGVRICFAPNMLEGQCYASEHADKSLRHADCTEPRTIKVVKRVDGSTDKSACPKHTRAVIYTQPGRTYCTERSGTSPG